MNLLLLLPLLLAPQGSAAKPGPADELRALGRAFSAEAFQLTPWEPALRGLRGKEHGLGGFEYAQRTVWLEDLRRIESGLGELVAAGLSGRELAEARALEAMIEGRLALYETRAPERWNALLHVERVERMLVASQSPLRSPADRRVAQLQLLRQFPAYWKQARTSLVSPSDTWSQAATVRLREILADLELHRDDLLGKLPPGKKALEAEKVFDRALAAAHGFEQWLAKNPSGLGVAQPTLGAERWTRLVRSDTGTTLDAQGIKTRVTFDLARRERRSGERWRAPEPGPVDLELVGGLEEELLRVSVRAMDLAARAGLLPELSPRGAVRFAASDQGRAFHRDVLFLAERGGDRGFVDPALLPGADAARLAALGIRYGFPGVALLRHEARASRSPIGRALWNRALFEGWGLYALDWLLRIDWVDSDLDSIPGLRAEADRQFVVEEARLLASLELHAQGYSEDEAVEGFRRRTGVQLEEARREVRLSLADPERGVGVLGWLELRAREEAYGTSQGPRRALGQNLAATLAAPYARPADRP